jgi:hypothetical protein
LPNSANNIETAAFAGGPFSVAGKITD